MNQAHFCSIRKMQSDSGMVLSGMVISGRFDLQTPQKDMSDSGRYRIHTAMLKKKRKKSGGRQRKGTN